MNKLREIVAIAALRSSHTINSGSVAYWQPCIFNAGIFPIGLARWDRAHVIGSFSDPVGDDIGMVGAAGV